MGSVKDMIISVKPSENRPGAGFFVFSDRYSVFDWGEMPDRIWCKGASLALMAAWNFEELERIGVNTHYIGLSREGLRLENLKKPTNVINIMVTRVIRPKFKEGKYDYSVFEKKRGKINNYLIPLEVIYRNGFPEGSSVFRKLKEGKITPKDIGLEKPPKPGDMLEKPIYDFWTKLEPTDRALSEEEAYRISGLSRKEFENLKEILGICNEVITKRCEEVGLINYDGKIELFKFGDLCVCDVLGTLDENRFAIAGGDLKGEQVSKEFLRQWYKKNDPAWVSEIGRAKKQAREEGVENWKCLCSREPISLPKELSDLVSQMYMSAANLYIGREIFDSPPLETVMGKLKKYR